MISNPRFIAAVTRIKNAGRLTHAAESPASRSAGAKPPGLSAFLVFAIAFVLSTFQKKTQYRPESRSALRLCVWLAGFYLKMFDIDNAFTFTLRTKQRKCLQHRFGQELQSRFCTAHRTQNPLLLFCHIFHKALPGFLHSDSIPAIKRSMCALSIGATLSLSLAPS